MHDSVGGASASVGATNVMDIGVAETNFEAPCADRCDAHAAGVTLCPIRQRAPSQGTVRFDDGDQSFYSESPRNQSCAGTAFEDVDTWVILSLELDDKNPHAVLLHEKLKSSIGHEFEMDNFLQEYLPESAPLRYKSYKSEGNSKLRGNLLHFAASHCLGHGPVKLLLQAKADARARACYTGLGGNECHVQASHFAAAEGQVETLEALLKYGKIDLDERDLFGGKDHCTPLHNAIWYQRAEATAWLLTHKANPNIRNANGFTPLHLAARQGDEEKTVRSIIEELIRHGASIGEKVEDADKYSKNYEGKTALQIAVSPNLSRFPSEILYLLAPSAQESSGTDHDTVALFEDVLTIAKVNFNAADAFTRKIEDSSVAARLTLEVNERPSVGLNLLVEVFKFVPMAGAILLNMLLKLPEVENRQHHPLPTQVSLDAGSPLKFKKAGYKYPLLSTYRDDVGDNGLPQWKWNSNTPPEWHNKWVAHPTNTDANYVVDVRVLLHPNVMKFRLLHVIAWPSSLWQHEVFGELTVQGLVSCAWSGLVMQVFYFHLSLEASILVSLQVYDCVGFRTVAWTILTGSLLREAIHILHGLVVYHGHVPNSSTIDFLSTIQMEIAATCLLAALVWSSAGFNDTHTKPELIGICRSCNILLRSGKAIWMLRALPGIGRQVLTIIGSFTGGRFCEMMFVTALIFLSFACAYVPIMGATLNWGREIKVLWKVILMSDSAELDELVGAATGHSKYMAFGLTVSSTLIFTLGVMNLIIAVLQKEYEDVEQKASFLFQNERARLSVKYMLHPAWPITWSLSWGSGLVVLLLSLWYGLLRTQMHAMKWMAAGCLMGGEVVFAALLLQNNWDLFDCNAHDRKSFLWICHRSDFDSSFAKHGDRANENEVEALAQRFDSLSRESEQLRLQLSQFLNQKDSSSESAPSPPMGGLQRGASERSYFVQRSSSRTRLGSSAEALNASARVW